MLVSMPIASPHYPSLALGLLKPAVIAAGMACDVRYFSLDYFDFIGAETHAALSHPAYYMAHVGEFVFAGAAHGSRVDSADVLTYLLDCFAGEFAAFHTPARLAAFLEARECAAEFIEVCFAAVDWHGYEVVGFSTSYQQTMASLALARRIKQSYPDMVIVFGGVNCQAEMGRALLTHYDCIDAVCLSEGDRCFPEMLRRRRVGLGWDDIAGLATRAGGRQVAASDAVIEMDLLPTPDYDDFFSQHVASRFAAAYTPAVVFETARGCWWGERHTCTFCGLNGTTVAFRAKSAGRAFDELAYLVRRHGSRFVANADKILDQRYFDVFLPRLAEAQLNLTIYYEVKVGLSAEQLALLARAGVLRVQFGIETFDTELLRLMAKGTTMLQNIEALKLSAEAGIYVEWLALSGFPGERAEQYDRLAELLPALFHLQPPSAFIRARADRFSPYQRDPSRYGIALEPLPAYRHIFPFDEAAVGQFANHFILRSAELREHDRYVAGAAAQYANWQNCFAESGLWFEDIDAECLAVHDTRGGRAEDISLWSGAAAALLRLCWRATRWCDILSALGRQYCAPVLADATAELAAHHLMINEGSRWIALVLRPPPASGQNRVSCPGPIHRAPTWAEVSERQNLAGANL